MAKEKSKSDARISVEFPRTGNAWLDAGTVGLYRVLDGRPAYVDEPSDTTEPPDTPGFEFAIENDRLILSGTASEIQGRLEWAYDGLVATYFNVSSRKQRDDAGSHNFYYDRATDQFVTFPKKKAVGAASLLFDKAARPSGTQDAWGAGVKGQREAGRMPASLSYLQLRLDAFLAKHSLGVVQEQIRIPLHFCYTLLPVLICGSGSQRDVGASRSSMPMLHLPPDGRAS